MSINTLSDFDELSGLFSKYDEIFLTGNKCKKCKVIDMTKLRKEQIEKEIKGTSDSVDNVLRKGKKLIQFNR